MGHRITLTTSSSPTGYAVKWVDVNDVEGLRRELERVGAKRWALYWRDALDDGHVEGKFKLLDELEPTHFEWLLEKHVDVNRQVLYDTKIPPP